MRCKKTVLGVLATLVLTLIMVSGIVSASAESKQMLPVAQAVWESAKVAVAPAIDGKVDEVWSKAKALEVVVREAFGGSSPIIVKLRAVHTDDTLYMLAEWDDNTKSDMRDPFVWNKEKNQYDRPTKPDDQFALQFPLLGDFDLNMLSMRKEFSSDVWHWKAGRGNPNGWVDDKRHIISQKAIEGGLLYNMGGRGQVYIARLMDAGKPAYISKEIPKVYAGDVIDSYMPQDPTGSLTDVRGKGMHDGKGWTLEMARKFKTGNADDAVIDISKDNTCSIAVLNDELFWDHSVSQIIRLRFVK